MRAVSVPARCAVRARVLITQAGISSLIHSQIGCTSKSDRFERQDGALQLWNCKRGPPSPIVARAGERWLA